MLKKERITQRVYFLILAVLVFPTEVGGQENEKAFLTQQRSIASSNSEAWKKYDFLLKESKFYQGDRPKGVPEAMTRWIRCAIDWEVGEVFCFVRLEGEGIDVDDKSESKDRDQASKKTYQHLIAKSGETSRNRKLPNPSQRILISEAHRLFNLFDVDVPDLRFVGIQPYAFGHHPTSTFEELVKGKRNAEPRATSPELSVKRERNAILVSQEINTIGRASFQFNATSLMRERFSWWLLENPNVRRKDEIISWLEKDGVYLPVEVVAETNEPQWSEFINVSIYWRSVNEPLERSLFDKEFLDDAGKVMKCIDVATFSEGGCLNKVK